MQYLSVHDLVWINNTLVGETVPFDYETLEQAMAAQYSYGKSTDAPAQAANLLHVFLTRKPFSRGTRRTAYIATIAFLKANGFELIADDESAPHIVRAVAESSMSAVDAISALSKPGGGITGQDVTLRVLVTKLCNEHQGVLDALTEGDD